MYTGAQPIYADIDPESYNVTPGTVEPCLTRRTRVVIAQSTFGLSPDLGLLMQLARRFGIYLVEDCAHGLGGSYQGSPNGAIADAAFFSTQWSKPVSTGIGGLAYTRNQQLASRIEKIVVQMPLPSHYQNWLLASQLAMRPLANVPRLRQPLIKTYRLLTQVMGMNVGSSSSQELSGTIMPTAYVKQMGALQRRRLKSQLAVFADQLRCRHIIAKRYDQVFADTMIRIPQRPNFAVHAMLRYAIRVPDKPATIRRAQENNILLGDWFSSPLHPVTGDLTPWHYRDGECPVAESVCADIINLPTDKSLSTDNILKILPDVFSAKKTVAAWAA